MLSISLLSFVELYSGMTFLDWDLIFIRIATGISRAETQEAKDLSKIYIYINIYTYKNTIVHIRMYITCRWDLNASHSARI